MKTGDPLIGVADAAGEGALEHARRLMRCYFDEFADSFAAVTCFQDFEADLAGLPGRYASPSGCLLLAMQGAIPAGCVAMRDLGVGTCEMKRLFVAPEFRGRGVGRTLVQEVIRRAERAGFRRMVLDTLPEMADAIVLYRSSGFVETSPYWECPLERTVFLEKVLMG
jgi:putative acetyltransferase